MTGRALWRRRLEPKQYTAIRYADRLAEMGAMAYIGTVGDSYDNAMAQSVIGLDKTECVRHDGPFRAVDDLELATLSWGALVEYRTTAQLHRLRHRRASPEKCSWSDRRGSAPIQPDQEHFHSINTMFGHHRRESGLETTACVL
jgi:hypothetical protein